MTSGEPAGIGPDICIRLAFDDLDARFVVLGDPALFAARARALGLDLCIDVVDAMERVDRHRAGRLQIFPVELAADVEPGSLNPANSRAVVEMLQIGATACMEGRAAALVTAPVHKSAIASAGIPFTGHTEFLGELTGVERTVMLLASPRLKVALATTHLPLTAVSGAITRPSLRETIRIVDRDLRRRFGVAHPRILVLGLNPHAGENGVLGTEEQETIAPVVAELSAAGVEVTGPVPADSAFTETSLARCDVVLAMYHDQGLPVLKARDFGESVNVTLGLPIIRTSVDHGTALDLAGSGQANHGSLRAALALAVAMTAAQGS